MTPEHRLAGRSPLGALVLVVALLVSGGARAEEQDFSPPASFQPLASEKLPAVVTVVSTAPAAVAGAEGMLPQLPQLPPGIEDFLDQFGGSDFLERFGQQQPAPMPSEALGSGFIIDPAGYVVTNNHVLAGGDVRITLQDGTEYAATIVGRDPRTDLALLRVESDEPLPALAWGDSNSAEVGDWVMAIGNPFGLGGTVTTGVISARAREIQAGPYDDFLQTDAAINRGNSGGPLIDMAGQVVGVNTAIFSPSGGSVGIGFAVPSSIAEPIVAQLRETGTVRRGWLGVQMQAMTDELAAAVGLEEARGVLVNDVVEGSPAAEAGVEVGDVVLSMGDTPIERMRDLSVAVANAEIGSATDITIWRDGEQIDLQPEIALLEDEVAEQTPAPEQEPAGPLGLTLGELNGERRAQLGLPEDATGALVLDVEPGSEALRQGLTRGDIIVRAGDQDVSAPADVDAAIETARQNDRSAVRLLVERGGARRFVALELEAG